MIEKILTASGFQTTGKRKRIRIHQLAEKIDFSLGEGEKISEKAESIFSGQVTQ